MRAKPKSELHIAEQRERETELSRQRFGNASGRALDICWGQHSAHSAALGTVERCVSGRSPPSPLPLSDRTQVGIGFDPKCKTKTRLILNEKSFHFLRCLSYRCKPLKPLKPKAEVTPLSTHSQRFAAHPRINRYSVQWLCKV